MKRSPALLALTLSAALLSAPLARAAACCHAPAPEHEAAAFSEKSLYQLDATWTDDRGNALTLGSLQGRPVVLAMVFANCSYACPILVNDMQRLRAALPDEVRERAQFVLVSFDHERDTPAALAAYRERVGLDPEYWTLLHGEPENIQELAMLLGIKFRRTPAGDYAHSNVITILNEQGEIVHQRPGLQGEVATVAKALTLVSR